MFRVRVRMTFRINKSSDKSGPVRDLLRSAALVQHGNDSLVLLATRFYFFFFLGGWSVSTLIGLWGACSLYGTRLGSGTDVVAYRGRGGSLITNRVMGSWNLEFSIALGWFVANAFVLV